MKRIILILTAILATLAPVQGDHGSTYFRDQEFSVDVFGAYSLGEDTISNLSRDSVNDGRISIGAGLNFFTMRYFGVGVDGYLGDLDGIMDHASISGIFRYPFDEVGIAPYAFGGVGRMWDPPTQYTGHLGAGFEVRWASNMGFFSDARFVFADKTDDFGLVRWGLRFAF